MAEENESNSVSEKKNNDLNHDLNNENEVELIDLANDDEQSKDVEKTVKEVQNGDSHKKDNGNELSKELVNSKNISDDEILLSDEEVDEEDPESADINDDNSQAKSETSPVPESGLTENNDKADNQNTKEEIIIEDEDEVQDLSTKNAMEKLIPKLSAEMTGFPSFLQGIVSLGECIAISKKSKSDIDIDKDCSILDCPSQVVPLIIKKSNTFPSKLKQEKDEPSKQVNHPTAQNQSSNNKNMLTISDFYSSSIGKFLIGIGLSRVKQCYHKDAINKVRKQIRKEGEAEDLMEELKKQQDYLNTCRAANSSYLFQTEKCEHCEFRTEFKSVLNQHMLYPHMTSRKEYKCNYCQFSTRDSKVIIGHVNMLHEKKCLIEIPPQLYECPICPYESGVKSKAATHIAKCLKFFVPDKLLVNKDDYFPTITPKPITQEDIKIYEATLQALRFAALNPQNKVPQIPGLPAGLQQQMYSIQQQQPRTGPGRPSKAPSNKVRGLNPFMMNQMNIKNLSPQLYQMLSSAPHGQFLQNQTAANLTLPQNFMNKHQQMLKMSTNSNSRPIPAPVSNNNTAPNNKPNIVSKQNNVPTNRTDSSSAANSKGSFVMCEICDGYIKDLEQLRTHMHWIHKVRIHPKMLANRPPLNCQKCQWRFFTDQGLERHLLGAHGLVTSNMQDMVNQNQDGGRCTICGRVFTSKLVTHMNQTHKINLKPAHLSYKCTVCSATFNLYRLFENHVYMVHSGSVKRNAEDASGQPPRKKTAMDSIIPNSAAAAANGN